MLDELLSILQSDKFGVSTLLGGIENTKGLCLTRTERGDSYMMKAWFKQKVIDVQNC